eukprot:805912-Pleurochrysis_carterae.AAC.1
MQVDNDCYQPQMREQKSERSTTIGRISAEDRWTELRADRLLGRHTRAADAEWKRGQPDHWLCLSMHGISRSLGLGCRASGEGLPTSLHA